MAKVGDKFIVEIGEVFHGDVVPDTAIYEDHELYLIKGFNSLVFDENGLNNLEKFDRNRWFDKDSDDLDFLTEQEKNDVIDKAFQNGYTEGLNDAWEAARKLRLSRENDPSMTELRNIFGVSILKNDTNILKDFSASEVVEKIKDYEEQKKTEDDEIKVGDEVLPLEQSEDVVIVTRKWRDDYERPRIDTINRNGRTWNYLEKDVKKTDRYFDIGGILKKL